MFLDSAILHPFLLHLRAFKFPKWTQSNILGSSFPKIYLGPDISTPFVQMPSVGWVSCTGSLVLQVSHASPNKTLILPFLDYCSCVWDSNYVLYTDKLESVQDFATKVITQQWNSCYDDQLKLLILPRLSTSRKRQKLSLCYRIVTGQSIIPPSFFIQNYCPSVFLLC